jgi:putative DNA-invertase from lambdoid prophage Rac
VLIEKGAAQASRTARRQQIAPRRGQSRSRDIVIAAKLDRLFRSALNVLKVVDSLQGRGVKLHLLDLGIAGNGISKLFLTIAAAFAEAERDRIRERIGQAKADQKSRGASSVGTCPLVSRWALTAHSSRLRSSRARLGKLPPCVLRERR